MPLQSKLREVKRDTKDVFEKALSESKAQDETKHTDFIIDKDTAGSNDQITINFNTNEAKAGDIYKIVIPEVGDGLDASGTYEASPGKFQGDYGSVDESVHDEEKKAWVITDRFTKTNSNNQPIVLTTKSNFDQNKLHSTGIFARKAYLYKNDELIKTLDFNQNVGSSASLWWDSSEGVYGGSSHSVYTMDNNETSVSDSSRGPELLANTDYKWKLNTCFSPNFNHGTEIVVPMADHFKLDLDQTNKLNENLQDQYGLTFTQDGNDVKVSFPKLTDDQLAKLNKDGNYKTSFDFQSVVSSTWMFLKEMLH